MSRLFLLSLALIVAGPACLASAQESPINLRRDHSAADGDITPGSVTATPDMWYYQQELKRHDDPKMAVRRRAEQRAQERHERLASQQWYGISNAAPGRFRHAAIRRLFGVLGLEHLRHPALASGPCAGDHHALRTLFRYCQRLIPFCGTFAATSDGSPSPKRI